MANFLIVVAKSLAVMALVYGSCWIMVTCAVIADKKRDNFAAGLLIGALINLIIILTFKMIMEV